MKTLKESLLGNLEDNLLKGDKMELVVQKILAKLYPTME